MIDCRLPAFAQQVRIKTHARARTLKLHIDPLHHIPVLTVPPHCSRKRIDAFLHSSRDWLQAKKPPASTTASFHPGSLSVAGQVYTLEMIENSRLHKVECDEAQAHIRVTACSLTQIMVLNRFLKEQALIYSKKFVQFHADQLNVKVTKVGVKEYKSRWGCCFQRGEIYLSWRLILAPIEVFQYVCAHEVAHLCHMNHSLHFWKTVQSIFPEYKENALWLKKNGRSLFTAV